jgi:hypothetical protein
MTFITDHELKWFRARYRHVNPDATLQYALNCADEYAERCAPRSLPSIKSAIAQLHFRHTLQSDPGEKQLIRIAIDRLIEMGDAINANAKP